MDVVQFLVSLINLTSCITLIPGLLLYYVFSVYSKTNKSYELKRQGFLGPNPWFRRLRVARFFFGNALEMDFEETKKYGKVFCINDADNICLRITDANLIKDVLVRHFSHFMDRRQGPESKYTSKFLTQLCGSEWKHTRSIISPTFTSGKMKAMLHLMKECLEPMMNRVRSNQGRDFDVRKLFGFFTMDVIGRCAFAVEASMNNDNDPFFVNANKFFQFSPLRILAIMLTPQFIREKIGLSFTDPAAIHYLAGLSQHVIDERRKKGVRAANRSYNDFLQLMLEAGREQTTETQEDDEEVKLVNESNKTTLTDEEIIGNAMLFLVAGYETTASLLAFASYVLAVHPDIQSRLRTEIQEAKKKNEDLDYETLTSLPYLGAFINETLRMYPPVTRFDRHCSEDVTLEYNGKTIRMCKGDSFVIPVYAVHHMEEYYPQPEEFRPERFLPENKDKLIPYTFLTFVAGPRNCIGMRFAMLEAKLAIASLLLEFDFVRSSRTSVPLDLSSSKIILTAKEVILKLEPRQLFLNS